MAEETLSFFEKIREIPFIKAYREKHQSDLKAYRERKFNEPAVLDKEYSKKLDTFLALALKRLNVFFKSLIRIPELLNFILIQLLKENLLISITMLRNSPILMISVNGVILII